MLQARVNELSSAILNTVNRKVHVIGFMREEILQSYLATGRNSWSSIGLYDVQDLEFHNIKDEALIIVQKNGEELNRHQYKVLKKKMIQFKDEKGKLFSTTFFIRKSVYSDHYHFYRLRHTKEIDKENKSLISKETQESKLFNDKQELDTFLVENFGIHFAEV